MNDLQKLWELALSTDKGFLVNQPLPIKLSSKCFEKWEDTVAILPQLLQQKKLRKAIEDLPETKFSDTTVNSKEEWCRIYVILSFLSHGYLWQDGEKNIPAELPSKLSCPWKVAADMIGVPPVITYAAVVLYNYTLRNPDGPCDASNLQAAVTFTGTKDESWFYMIHVLEEIVAAPGLWAMCRGYEAMSTNDNATLAGSINTITVSLEAMKEIFEKMKENCDPFVFYNEFRPFLSFPENGLVYKGVSEEKKHYRSASGAQDSAIPAFSIFLGVTHGDKEQEILTDFMIYMPQKHCEFLKLVNKQPSVKDYVKCSEDVELLKSYNEAVDALVAFRSAHIKLVTSYIINVRPHQGNDSVISESDLKGTGGTPFMRFLKNVKDDTSNLKLK